jgi:transposase, IS30 family
VAWRERPPERVRLVLDYLAAGLPPTRAAVAAGVAPVFAYELRRRMGGVYRPASATYSARYLTRDERYELARLRDSGLPVRAVAARMGRSPSTICRELARNVSPRGGYQPELAHRMAWERQRRPRPSKLAANPALRAAVQRMLDQRYSPEQASGRLKALYPGEAAMQVSHETIYQSIYVYPRGQLRRELRACLRTGRAVRRRRGVRPRSWDRIVGAVPIGQRPAEAEGRLVPGHHEGDLIIGSTASNSAVGTIVERTTGYLTLLPLHAGRDAATVADAVIEHMSALPPWFARTLTWDRGVEMAQHRRITAATGIDIYFADPYAPWQRGSNENINGLLREYLPKGADLRAWTPAQLQQIAAELNDRPRKRLGFRTPAEQFAKLLEQDQERVATTP